MFYDFFYNIAMSKARRIRKYESFSVFTSGEKFSVFILSYVNTALNQSAFRIHKFYIIIYVGLGLCKNMDPFSSHVYFINQ